MSKKNPEWLKRRWLDFRQGHTIYLAFIMNFANFVIISYTLAIDRFTSLESLFPSMWQWSLFFLAIYLPSAVIVGHFHMTKQLPTDTRRTADENPFSFYTTPGKEQLYNLPSALTGLELQKLGMMQQNAIADMLEDLAKDNGKAIPIIPRFTQEHFKQVDYWYMVVTELKAGKSIKDIIKKI